MNQNNANSVPTFTHNFISENMGKEIQTPDGSSKIFHISGFNDQDLFFSCVNGFSWDCKFGWENKSQRISRQWRDEFEKLDQKFKKIILIPKAVFAGVCASFIIRCFGENFDDVQSHFIDEWDVLHNNEIIPQKPIKRKNVKIS